jgi:hypothetical protein
MTFGIRGTSPADGCCTGNDGSMIEEADDSTVPSGFVGFLTAAAPSQELKSDSY